MATKPGLVFILCCSIILLWMHVCFSCQNKTCAITPEPASRQIQLAKGLRLMFYEPKI